MSGASRGRVTAEAACKREEQNSYECRRSSAGVAGSRTRCAAAWTPLFAYARTRWSEAKSRGHLCVRMVATSIAAEKSMTPS